MAWVRIDDQARCHRKLLAAGPIAAWLWACGLMYCNAQKAKDGFIPDGVLPVLYPLPRPLVYANKLVAVGLWDRVVPTSPRLLSDFSSSSPPVPPDFSSTSPRLLSVFSSGFQIHDYHDYQPNSEQAEAISNARSLAGKLGGVRSGEVRRSKAESKVLHDAEAESKQVASSKTNPVPSRPDPSIQTETPLPPEGVAPRAPGLPDRVFAEYLRRRSSTSHHRGQGVRCSHRRTARPCWRGPRRASPRKL